MTRRRPPQLPPNQYIGGVRIFFTMCTFRRTPWFTSYDVVALVRGGFLQLAERLSVEIIAYCFMPDHLHFLSAGVTGSSNAKALVERFRRQSGYTFRRRSGTRLWQEGYFDRILRTEDATFDVAAYILANPVRAHLAATVSEFPFSGSSRYSLAEIASFTQWRP